MSGFYWIGAVLCFATALLYAERGSLLMDKGTQGAWALTTRVGHFAILATVGVAFSAIALGADPTWFRFAVAAAAFLELVGHIGMRVKGSPPT